MTRRLAYRPRFSSRTTELRLLKRLRELAFTGGSVEAVAAAESLIRLGREQRGEKERTEKLKAAAELARTRLREKRAREKAEKDAPTPTE